MTKVDKNTPVEGTWNIIDKETLRYRTTPDKQFRDEYGIGNDPPPEAIARAMAELSTVAPNKTIIEVQSDTGAFLGRFTVTKNQAQDFVEYQIDPDRFTNITGESGQYTDGYFTDGRAAILTIHTNHLELRRAYLNRTVAWVRKNASDSDVQLAGWGLYNKSYNLPVQDLKIKSNSTIFISLLVGSNEGSDTLGTITEVWPILHSKNYYLEEAPITIQVRLYYSKNGSFDQAWNIHSSLASEYGNGNMSFTRYFKRLVDLVIEDEDELPSLPQRLNTTQHSHKMRP